MGRRFSRYKLAKKLAGGRGEAGSALSRYVDYAEGKTRLNYPRDAASKQGGIVIIYLNSFLNPGSATQLSKTTMSERAFNNLNNLIDVSSKFNHQTYSEETDTILLEGNWEPAKAIIRTGGTGVEEETSQITGEKYQKKVGEASYTVPFGGDSGSNFYDTAADINAGVEAQNAAYTVSFTPEKIMGL